MAFELAAFEGLSFSVAMTAETDAALGAHVHKPGLQEDLTFAYWRPSRGRHRYSAILERLEMPGEGDRVLQGNVSFLPAYLRRVLAGTPSGSGIALLHGHLGPGWQGMSEDDVVAERDRLAGAVAGRTGLPVVGLTRGTDGTWSARIWPRQGPRSYARIWASDVRVVGRHLRISRPPAPPTAPSPRQVATASVWGREAQAALAAVRVGIIGLGSVGSLVAEALARTGVSHLTYVDFDRIEERNLDRTLGATSSDALVHTSKVDVALRTGLASATAQPADFQAANVSLLQAEGLGIALDCDVLFSCVDRPLPRHVLNAIAYGHLIPVIDGGALARVRSDGRPLHIDWRIHTVGPDRTCLVCLGALRRSDVALDREGRLDDPDYIRNLPPAEREAVGRRNVFAFAMSVAAHEAVQFAGLVTGFPQVGGSAPQFYHAFPGRMDVLPDSGCEEECEYRALLASAPDLTSNLVVPTAAVVRASEPAAPSSLVHRLRARGRRFLGRGRL